MAELRSIQWSDIFCSNLTLTPKSTNFPSIHTQHRLICGSSYDWQRSKRYKGSLEDRFSEKPNTGGLNSRPIQNLDVGSVIICYAKLCLIYMRPFRFPSQQIMKERELVEYNLSDLCEFGITWRILNCRNSIRHM